MSMPFVKSDLLDAPSIRHGFFGRAGGVSKGIYAALNTGAGSDDKRVDVTENRRRCADVLNVAPNKLLTNYQIHSNNVVFVDGPFHDGPPKADALVTTTPGLALGALAADCMPWLFHDPVAHVIAAAHAGWRGALAGVLENTVETMIDHDATPENIRACLGPCLRQPQFEVGLDLVDAFTAKYSTAEQFFAPGTSMQKRQFDLAGFGFERLRILGVTQIDDVDRCTLGDAEQYFSYRASRQRHEPDYGRNLSAIALLEKN